MTADLATVGLYAPPHAASPAPARPIRSTSGEPRRFHGMRDPDLLEQMRNGELRAWNEFDRRFRPLLKEFARRQGLPSDAEYVCVDDVLAEEGIRLTHADAGAPSNLTAYLLRAARHRFYNYRREVARRYARYIQLAAEDHVEGVVVGLCSEYTQRSRAWDGVPDDLPGGTPDHTVGECDPGRPAIAHLMAALEAGMTPEERLVLDWVASRVPQSLIASWLGRSQAATSKRVWRLLRRLRLTALDELASLPPEAYREIERVLRRADVATPRTPVAPGSDNPGGLAPVPPRQRRPPR